jgi:hypothetical protein
MTRDQAIEEINKPIYDPELLRMDMEFVLKKFGLTESEFNKYMNEPIRSHKEYGIEKPSPYDYFPLLKPAKKILGYLRKKELCW